MFALTSLTDCVCPQALDAKGEWWVDVATDTLYILPNTTTTDSESEVRFELYFQPYLRSISA